MDKKVRKTFQPGYSGSFAVMLCFCLAAAIMRNYYLAGIGFALTVIMTVIYMVSRKQRNRDIQAFVQEAFRTADFTSKGTECPLPMAMIRLGDNGVVWASDRFVSVTGMKERLPEERIDQLLPGISMAKTVSRGASHSTKLPGASAPQPSKRASETRLSAGRVMK